MRQRPRGTAAAFAFVAFVSSCCPYSLRGDTAVRGDVTDAGRFVDDGQQICFHSSSGGKLQQPSHWDSRAPGRLLCGSIPRWGCLMGSYL